MSLTVHLTSGSGEHGSASFCLGNGEPLTVRRVKELVSQMFGVAENQQKVVCAGQLRKDAYLFGGDETITVFAHGFKPRSSPEEIVFSELISFARQRPEEFPAFFREKLDSLPALNESSVRICMGDELKKDIAVRIEQIEDPLIRRFLDQAFPVFANPGESFDENVWKLYERTSSVYARSISEDERKFTAEVLNALRGFQGFAALQNRRQENLRKDLANPFQENAGRFGAAQFLADRWRAGDANGDFRLFEVEDWGSSGYALIVQARQKSYLDERPFRFQMFDRRQAEAIDVRIGKDTLSCVVCARRLSNDMKLMIEDLAGRFDFEIYYAVQNDPDESVMVEVVENVADPKIDDWRYRLQREIDRKTLVPFGQPPPDREAIYFDVIRLIHATSGDWYLSFVPVSAPSQGVIRKIEDPFLLDCLKYFPQKNAERLQLLLRSEVEFPHLKGMVINPDHFSSMTFRFAEQAASQPDFHEECKKRSESLRPVERRRMLQSLKSDSLRPFVIQDSFQGAGVTGGHRELSQRAAQELARQPPEGDLPVESLAERMERFLSIG